MTIYNRIGSLLLLLCLGSLAHADQDDAHDHSEHHDFPKAVAGFHDVMAPLWHSPAGEQRQKNICTQYPSLIKQWNTLQAAPSPQDVNPAQWTKAVSNLGKVLTPIEQICADDDNPEYMLANVHHGFH